MCGTRNYRVPKNLNHEDDDAEGLLEEFFAERNRQLEFDKLMNRVERLKDSSDSEAVARELQHVLAVLERCKYYEEGH